MDRCPSVEWKAWCGRQNSRRRGAVPSAAPEREGPVAPADQHRPDSAAQAVECPVDPEGMQLAPLRFRRIVVPWVGHCGRGLGGAAADQVFQAHHVRRNAITVPHGLQQLRRGCRHPHRLRPGLWRLKGLPLQLRLRLRPSRRGDCRRDEHVPAARRWAARLVTLGRRGRDSQGRRAHDRRRGGAVWQRHGVRRPGGLHIQRLPEPTGALDAIERCIGGFGVSDAHNVDPGLWRPCAVG